MIRINLLATERRAAKAAAPGFQAGQKMMVIGSLVLVLTAVGVGWRYWALGQQKAQVAREIEAAQREEARLQEILKQVAGVREPPQDARGARRADRRAAQGPDRAGPHDRSGQPGAARHDLADRDASRAATR